MVKIGALLTLILVLICYFMTLAPMSKNNDDYHENVHQKSGCQRPQDVSRIVDTLDSKLKEDNQAIYDEVSRYLVEDNGYSIEIKRIIKGFWVPIDDKIAAARSTHRNFIYFFEDAGKWFTDGNKEVERLEVNQPYTNTLLLVRDAGIVTKSELETLDQLCALHVVIWLEKYIINVNLDEKSVVIFNRGS